MKYTVLNVAFESGWILSRRGDEKLPVDRLIHALKKQVSLEVKSTSLMDCKLIIKEEQSGDSIRKMIADVLNDCYGPDFDMTVVTCDVKEQESKEKEDEFPEHTDNDAGKLLDALKALERKMDPEIADKKEEYIPEEQDESLIDKITGLIGAAEFKQLAEECVKMAPGIHKYRTEEAFLHQTYLFSINDGNGLSTYLKLFGELLNDLGLFDGGSEIQVAETTLPPQNALTPGMPLFDTVQKYFTTSLTNKHARVICIDISEWMTKTGDIMFRRLLADIDCAMRGQIVVFRVPFVEKDILQDLKRNIGDLLFVRDVSVVPFDKEELDAYAKNALTDWGFTMAEDAWEIFDARIMEEKSDGRFYGINTVNKVIREMIYHKQRNNAYNGMDDALIKKSEILPLAPDYNGASKKGMELLDDMVGMAQLKERVIEIINQIEMTCKNEDLDRPCIHMRFVGNPGTGKTTVARVIGQILKEKGILRNGSFFEYAGRDFCGRYVGETAPKTAAMCRDAYGSVLFIDEAYTLYRSDNIGSADYGREAIDTLIAEMENHRSDLVVIMAGYPEEMATLMKGNAGLASRMPYVIEFPNYSRDELYEIFIKMAEKTFDFADGCKEAVKEYFDSLTDDMIYSKEFSNARFVRNLYERTWGKAILRTQLDKSDRRMLIKEDFLLASSEKEFKKTVAKKSRSLGFI